MIRSLILLLAGVGPAPAPKPRLVVVITVDQLRPDYLERYRPQLLGGFATLLRTGASFADAYQDHAVTETAPGHSTILSGRRPGRARSLDFGEGPRRDSADRPGQRGCVLVFRRLFHHESLLRRFPPDVGPGLQRAARSLPRGGDPVDAVPPGAGLP